MKKYNTRILFFLCSSLVPFLTQAYNPRPPRLTVVLVVDQCAQHYLQKLAPHLKHGLKFLMDNGVMYTNAHMPHGQPGTATGHAGLSTGTCAKDHGFVSNGWFTEDGTKVACDDDNSGNALVLQPDGGTYDYGKSAHMLMVDGLSDQCVLQTEPNSAFAAYSISLKSRAAVATASKLGKAIWFDEKTGLFTSSKAYFDELPQWLQSFNVENNCNYLGSIVWERMYQKSPYAYQFFDINNYAYTRYKKSLLNQPIAVADESHPQNKYHLFEKTPQANKLLFDCALSCINQHVGRKHRNRLLLWLCLSPLDKLVHKYGSNSMEAIDMMYHLDKQIQQFIRGVYHTIGKHEVAFVLTADHAVMPLPELLHAKGLTQAERINRIEFVKNINSALVEDGHIDGIVKSYKGQELVFDAEKTKQLSVEQQKTVTDAIKKMLLKMSGIKAAWTYDELMHTCTQPNTLEDNIKNQLFPGRSGAVIVQPYPYSVISRWPVGASHKTPYDYDTHVPLIMYHPGRFARKYVRQRVVALQLANTLAEILNVPKPSASTYEILPELFDPEYK